MSKNDKIEENLVKLGLQGSEIDIYLYLLEHGVSTGTQISKGTGILRTNTYAVLDRLMLRALVEKNESVTPMTYAANNPTSLLRDIESRKEIIDSVLPDLNNLYKGALNKPIIKFYDGKDQVREVFFQMLDTKELLGFVAHEQLFELLPDFFPEWRRRFKQRGGLLRDIMMTEGENKMAKVVKKDLKNQYQYRLIPPDFQAVPTDILVWDDNLALLTLKKPVFATVISNKAMADTYRLMFELIWRSLPVSG